MNELQVIDKKNNDVADFDVAFRDIENTQKLCAMLMKTPHYQKIGQDGIFAILAKARGLGINPLDALNGGLYYVQGKVGMSSEMMATLIRKQGHNVIKDPKSTNDLCILHGKRSDNGDTWTVSFGIEDAKRAGLYKNMYEKYPAVMLYNRAMSMLARQLFPDIIKGAGYTFDELKEIASNKNESSVEHSEPFFVEKVQTIGELEAKELDELLKLVPEYREIVMKHLAKQNIIDLQDLPCELYERIYTKAIELVDAKKEDINDAS